VSEEKSVRDRIAEKWSAEFRQKNKARTRWWQSPHIIRHINKKLSGNGFEEEPSLGLTNRAKVLAGDRCPFIHGVSVGCGNGSKEVNLLRDGLVKTFSLFDLSEECLRQARELAEKNQVAGRIQFHCTDAFEVVKERECFDFIHWNNSLHHMFDVDMAVKWSYEICKKGGMFYMDDFVGPSRFQWSDQMLQVASRVRAVLPEKYLSQPVPASYIGKVKWALKRLLFSSQDQYLYSTVISRPTVEAMIADDPSEAADSTRILAAVKNFFPDAEVTLTGGAMYGLALNDILQNFDEHKDAHLLDLILIIDDLCAALGETQYATALAIKN
jgi:2-polyprenyl-3-methyl-5-hydroxy-6-metoxy-1,4-benzoquinol methylase